MSTTELVLPKELYDPEKILELRAKATELLPRVREIQITDDATLAEVLELGRVAKLGEDQAEENHRLVVNHWYKKWKAACNELNEEKDPFTEAKRLCSSKAGNWRAAQETKRRQQEQAIQAQLRKQAEDAQIAAAQKAQDAGRMDVAETIISTPVQVPAVIMPAPAKTQGAIPTKKWKATRIDKDGLLRALVAGGVSVETASRYLEINEGEVNREVNRLKETFPTGDKKNPDGSIDTSGRWIEIAEVHDTRFSAVNR